MRRWNVSRALLALLFVGACHAQILIPGHEDEYSSVVGCSGGACMPTHPLQVFVGAPANREVHVTLLNPHGDDEECDVREEGDRQIATCSYRVVRGFSAPYYFLIVLSRARDAAGATCAVNPELTLVHRLDRYVRFRIVRQRVIEGGPCVYIASEETEPSPT